VPNAADSLPPIGRRLQGGFDALGLIWDSIPAGSIAGGRIELVYRLSRKAVVLGVKLVKVISELRVGRTSILRRDCTSQVRCCLQLSDGWLRCIPFNFR
jgi:hypothetical protein